MDTPSNDNGGPAPPGELAGTPRLAAEALLQRDARPRDVMVNEMLREFTLGESDATRCVKLAAAKLAWQELHPETVRGRAPKPKKKKNGGKNAESASFPPFEEHAEGIIGGWKARTISRWCKIGLGLSQVAYERLLGTPLATDLGALETLSALSDEERQVDVADLFAQRLEREGRDLLASLATQSAEPPTDDQVPVEDVTASDWADIVQLGPDGDAPPPPTPPVVENPLPEHATELELTKAADGRDAYCILHGHVLAVADLGDAIRLTYIGKARAASKPEAVNRESWIDAVGRAARTINGEGRYVATVSQITWVPPNARLPAHHAISIRCEPTLPLGRNREIVIAIKRWANAEPTIGFGEGSAFDPYRSRLPVLTIADASKPQPWLAPVPYDWTEANPYGPHIVDEILGMVAPVAWRSWRPSASGLSPEDYAMRVLEAKAARRAQVPFRWKSHEWFASRGCRRRPFVQQSTQRDRRLVEVARLVVGSRPPLLRGRSLRW